MANISLGIHIGHDSACAIVADGKVIAATQQERHTRRKHDGHIALNSGLPIAEVLSIAGISMSEVTTIVTSYQSVCPGGVGLQHPMWTSEFDAYDPFDPRHFVVSHHLAHAMCAYGSAGFESAACLVCDLAGSTTVDGADFYLPFRDFYNMLTRPEVTGALRTENLSFYHIDPSGARLIEREFANSSSVSHVTVSGLASLYDNASRHVFGGHDAHGQLMALASLHDSGIAIPLCVDDIIDIDPDLRVRYKNGWQSAIPRFPDPLDAVGFARLIQNCFNAAILAYVRRLQELTHQGQATFSGGVFLNIVGNSAIAESGLFSETYFPSVPNDSGIALGCAYLGQSRGGKRPPFHPINRFSDRLGKRIDPRIAENAIALAAPFVVSRGSPSAKAIARNIHEGLIYARCSGRSEFGPRALGGRSILSSPLLASSKQRSNSIKGRQAWRPVAPIVLEDRFDEFFEGTHPSPFMNLVHRVKDNARALLALEHPDGSTRVQTLSEEEDPELYQIIAQLAEINGFPILMNTSLNGPSEPMMETAFDAIRFYRQNPDVDRLLLDRFEIGRHDNPLSLIDSDTIVQTASSTVFAASKRPRQWIVANGKQTCLAPTAVFRILEKALSPLIYGQLVHEINQLNEVEQSIIRKCFDLNILMVVPPQGAEAQRKSSSILGTLPVEADPHNIPDRQRTSVFANSNHG
jgi:carbamoyltransferase